MKKLSVISLLLLVSLTVMHFSGCQKELQDDAKYAVFTTEANGACMGIAVAGFFFRTIPMNDSNFIRLSVNVSSTGNYHISTDTINGIYFASTGVFSATGIQQVLLKAFGACEATGTYTYKVQNSICSVSLVVYEPLIAFGDFRLLSINGICSSPQITGVFIEGVNTAPSNNVMLKVFVLNTGRYVFSTDTVNGISFYGSGEFADTGIQQIPLYASGTPQHKGIYPYYPVTTEATCSFNITVEDPASIADYTVIAGPGNPGACDYTVTGNYIAGLALIKANNATIAISVSKTGTYTVTTNTVNGMIFSSSGTFITIGRQVINIYGSGTPVEKGQFELTPTIIGPHLQMQDACTFQVTVF